jgi:cysteine synthase A
MARRAAREEGMLVGISSGATLAAIAQKLKELPAGSRVLGFNYDTGERYLSVPDFLPVEKMRRGGLLRPGSDPNLCDPRAE